MTKDRQLTFSDSAQLQRITHGTEKQKRIISLLAGGTTPGTAAKRTGTSRSYVSKIAGQLERSNLIKGKPGKYNRIYDASQTLLNLIASEEINLTACRVHNIAMHYKIIRKSGALSVDKRSGFSKDWTMRGGKRFAYWYPGAAGEPSITVTAHPNSIVIRMDKGQKILAASSEEAEDKGFQHLALVRQQFIDAQRKFGVVVDIEPTGRKVGKVHYGFSLTEETAAAKQGVTLGKWFIDKSVKEVEPDKLEVETLDKAQMTPLDRTILMSHQLSALPELLKGMESNLQVIAQAQGGRTVEAMLLQLIDMQGRLMERIEKQDAKIRELERERGA